LSTAGSSPLSIHESDLHAHLQARLAQRGITFAAMQQTLAAGWQATDCRPGTLGKVFVFSYKAEWEGRFYGEKEVTVYYKVKDDRIILLTAKARYGQGFPRGEMTDENRV
jgi:hypothetical protein